MTRAAHILAILMAMALLSACGSQAGGDAPPSAPRSDRLVDFSKKPPYVNALDVDPASGEYLLTTNRGYWRIDPETDEVRRVRGTIEAEGKSSTVGTFLAILAASPGRLIGSGHPDQRGTLPQYLGLIASDDTGRTWEVVARLGEADLHKIVLKHGRLYAFDAVLGALLISRDGGRTFEEQFTPRQLVIDLEVDPRQPERIFASTERELFRSENGGRSWRPADAAEGIRLVWPAPDAFYRAERDGTVQRSRDGGSSWERVGHVAGEPYKLKALEPERLLLALSDGTIVETADGGRTWKEAFRP
ncbi:MAG: WD40/YVTN/BNR-like repeat-containing protein [Solirubrobacteraceae bacterium]